MWSVVSLLIINKISVMLLFSVDFLFRFLKREKRT